MKTSFSFMFGEFIATTSLLYQNHIFILFFLSFFHVPARFTFPINHHTKYSTFVYYKSFIFLSFSIAVYNTKVPAIPDNVNQISKDWQVYFNIKKMYCCYLSACQPFKFSSSFISKRKIYRFLIV